MKAALFAVGCKPSLAGRMRCKDYFCARLCFECLLLGSGPEQTLDELPPPDCVSSVRPFTYPFLIMCCASISSIVRPAVWKARKHCIAPTPPLDEPIILLDSRLAVAPLEPELILL
jgi:hypothetical protein